jgi:regulator of protease activity HflC (stomatin/prohibitin superfamily)
MDPKNQAKLFIVGAAALFAIILGLGSAFTIPPGHRGVMVTMGFAA